MDTVGDKLRQVLRMHAGGTWESYLASVAEFTAALDTKITETVTAALATKETEDAV